MTDRREPRSAVVLAGGRSSRMGFDKQRVELNGTWLMGVILEQLRTIFGEIVVVTTDPGLYHNEQAVVAVRDEIPGHGPLGGLHAGLKRIGCEYAYLIACDMPNIDAAFVEFLYSQVGDGRPDACVARYGDWYEPFHALYAARIVDRLEAFLSGGGRKIIPFLSEIDCRYLDEDVVRRFTPDWSLFANINTRDDLARHSLFAVQPGNPIEYRDE